MPRKDINEIAFGVVQEATGEVPKPVESARAKAGRKGGIKGGMSRASSLTPEKRSALATAAARARWAKKRP